MKLFPVLEGQDVRYFIVVLVLSLLVTGYRLYWIAQTPHAVPLCGTVSQEEIDNVDPALFQGYTTVLLTADDCARAGVGSATN